MEWRRVLFVLLVCLTVTGSSWYLYDFASRSDLRGYIGDEVWYVPASRNVLHLLGVELHYINETTGSEGVNIIFSNQSTRIRYQYEVEKIALRHNATYEKEYLKFPGVYFEVPPDNLESFLGDVEEKLPEDAYYTVTGYWYPDKDNIQNYLNTEHPFLGKDLIMLGMLLGDRPINWRLPGIVAFAIIQVLVVVAAYRISRSYLAALIALVFTAADPTLQALGVAAMLDIHVALFVALTVALMVLGRDSLASVSLGLAASAKLSGGFLWPVLLVRALKRERSFFGFVLRVFLLPSAAFLLPNLTAMGAIGPKEWLRQFLWSFKWQISPKAGHPAASPVWEWFINKTAFPLHYNPNIFAQTDPFLLLGMAVFIFALPWLYRKRPAVLVPFASFWSIVLMFVVYYAVGGKTQLSFYATILVPPAAVVMGVALNELLRWEAFKESLRLYLGWLLEIKDRIRARLGR
ncbi:dolichyl-phosphate-mannose--protein mannosyltransferase [Thermococcus sp. M36]|uniref:dolichyl-phosphate-mannose--protein mannosyltransferase n=1 Tax=Thermococcus sp. M36 TaxID=1638261 RepID=UPI00143B3AD3|nr:dolichyl-phosphate-mannose--protein mannosyltransferase [Thermococcus sp. M36]NJE04611.1 dolichyl-phosphate-mannose--protein mannosyltransferase [Thermococcus sp. M36]